MRKEKNLNYFTFYPNCFNEQLRKEIRVIFRKNMRLILKGEIK